MGHQYKPNGAQRRLEKEKKNLKNEKNMRKKLENIQNAVYGYFWLKLPNFQVHFTTGKTDKHNDCDKRVRPNFAGVALVAVRLILFTMANGS